MAPGIWSTGSIVVVHRFSCSATCGLLPDQGSNPCPLHWQANSYPMHHQASPRTKTFWERFRTKSYITTPNLDLKRACVMISRKVHCTGYLLLYNKVWQNYWLKTIFIITQFAWIRNLDMAYLIEASVSRSAIKVPAGLQNSQGSAGEYPVPYSLTWYWQDSVSCGLLAGGSSQFLAIWASS